MTSPVGVSFKEFDALSGLRNAYFEYDLAKEALRRISDFHRISWGSRPSDFMLFYGVTGCGKTTIARKYFDSLKPDTRTPQRNVPALYVSVPSYCTPKALAEALLCGLDDPRADRGTLHNMTRRVVAYSKAKEVSLIILDEFQHFMNRENLKVVLDATDWLKALANDISCPILAVGLPSTIRIIKHNEQLERRVVSNVQLVELPLDTPSDVKRFRTLVALFAREMPFRNPELLVTEKVTRQLHENSMGVLGRLVRILRLTGEIAIRSDSTTLKPAYLDRAIFELCELSPVDITKPKRLKGSPLKIAPAG